MQIPAPMGQYNLLAEVTYTHALQLSTHVFVLQGMLSVR